MKQSIFFFLFFSISYMYGQGAQMLNEGRKWVCEESYFFLENSPVKRYLQEIAGDTIIGGFTYKKILTDGVYCAALRQDGEKRLIGHFAGYNMPTSPINTRVVGISTF